MGRTRNNLYKFVDITLTMNWTVSQNGAWKDGKNSRPTRVAANMECVTATWMDTWWDMEGGLKVTKRCWGSLSIEQRNWKQRIMSGTWNWGYLTSPGFSRKTLFLGISHHLTWHKVSIHSLTPTRAQRTLPRAATSLQEGWPTAPWIEAKIFKMASVCKHLILSYRFIQCGAP